MRLGPYELVRLIGAGGMGEVWAAHRASVGSGELVALKRLPERLAGDPTYRRILLDEARLSMLLRHRNIVHVFDAGEADGEAYIAMEFVSGLDLSRLRKLLDRTHEELSIRLSAYVIGEVLEGLAYAHNLVHEGELISLVHRDVSPHNVMLATNGEIKLTDFGVARLSSEDTSGTHVKGKARYMPPEQLRGDSRSPTVDLFAAGAVLHEMLDGRTFRGEAIDDARLLGMAIDGVVPPLRRSLAGQRELEQLRRGLLEPDPQKRIPSANAALDLLHRWPGYRDAAAEVADLAKRYLEYEVSPDVLPTETNLAHQATFLQTNDAIRLESSEDVLDEDEVAAPDELLLAVAEGRDEATGGSLGPVEELGHTAGRGPASTGGHTQVPWSAAGEDSPELDLDLPGTSFARHVATSPNPVIQPRRWPRVLGLGLGLALLIGLGWFGATKLLDHPPNTPDPSADPPSPGLRDARVVGEGFAGEVGFRLGHMDKLATEDILYEYLDAGSEAPRPLAALAAGEAEFAVTTLDRLLLEHAAGTGSPGKVVALVDLSLGAHALVLDTKERPRLRSLDELAKLARKSKPAPLLAYAADTPSAYLDLRFDALLDALDRPELGHRGDYPDARAVYEALLADADPEAPVVAAILPEPWLGKATEAGMSVALGTRDLPGALVGVLVASPRVLAEQPALVDAVVGAYYAGIVTQQGNPEDLLAKLTSELGLSEDEAARTLAGLCLFDAAGAQAWTVASESGPAPLARAIETTWSTLRGSGRVRGEAPKLDELVETRALVAATQRNGQAEGDGELGRCLAREPTKLGHGRARALGELDLPAADKPWFLPGEAKVEARRAAAVAELAARLAAFNPSTVRAEIIGFGDVGGAKGRSLGEARARAIVEALEAAGVELPLMARGAGHKDAPTTLVRVSLER
jgi:serine/threonine protein kinase/outer membrane protein OmpA-like peptidoglycan-associated protein